MNRILPFLLSLLVLITVSSCEKEEPENEDANGTNPSTPDTSVSYDLDAWPYEHLSDYSFFDGEMKDLIPSDRVLPYEVISPLFSDYAHKARFIWMPEGSQATYDGDGKVLAFPEGTVMVKVFYYDNVQPSNERRIIETRLLIKRGDVWEFAEYVWNEEQTEATYFTQGDNTQVEWINEDGETMNVNYRIPSMDGGECLTCHKKLDLAIPIGPKPQNLNKVYDYDDGSMNQLEKWASVGFLNPNYPGDILTTVDWKDESLDTLLRIRSYIDMNCAHCHAEESHCDYRPMRFAFSETASDENLGICVSPDEEIPGQEQLIYIIGRGVVGRSMLSYRMNSVLENERMPILGRTIVHEEAVALIDGWIESLEPACN